MATKAPSPTKVVTGKVRLSYVHLFEPHANPNQKDAKPKYSCVILVPKTDRVTINKIRKAQEAALEAGKTSRFDGRIPKNWKNTFRDGDEEADLELNPEYEGCYFMTVSSNTKPGIVDQDVQPILDATDVYSGCYARVSINAFPFNVSGNKGVSFGLNHVQKIADGEPLGGFSRAEDDFEPVARESDDDEDGLL